MIVIHPKKSRKIKYFILTLSYLFISSIFIINLIVTKDKIYLPFFLIPVVLIHYLYKNPFLINKPISYFTQEYLKSFEIEKIEKISISNYEISFLSNQVLFFNEWNFEKPIAVIDLVKRELIYSPFWLLNFKYSIPLDEIKSFEIVIGKGTNLIYHTYQDEYYPLLTIIFKTSFFTKKEENHQNKN